jgi:hypothetical protein
VHRIDFAAFACHVHYPVFSTPKRIRVGILYDASAQIIPDAPLRSL